MLRVIDSCFVPQTEMIIWQVLEKNLQYILIIDYGSLLGLHWEKKFCRCNDLVCRNNDIVSRYNDKGKLLLGDTKSLLQNIKFITIYLSRYYDIIKSISMSLIRHTKSL